MRCAIPTCDSDHSSSQGISFHRLPEVRFLYAAWEKAFSKAGLRLEPGSVVCSKHFLEKALFDTTSGRHVHAGALPILKEVCRICLSTDCELYSMTTSDTLNEAYEKLTGLSISDLEHLPRYLCGQCAGRLVESERFRSRSLRAHVMLLGIIRRHGAITVELIQSMTRTINPANSSHSPSIGFDLHNGQLEEVCTFIDARGDTRLDAGMDENIDDIKTEIDYAIDQSGINGDDITNDVDEVKTEIDDLMTQDNVKAHPSNVDEDIYVDVVTNANCDAISQDDRSVCSSNVDEDVVVDDEMKTEIEDDNISNDDFINGEPNELWVYSAGLYEHTVGNTLKITHGDEPDYRSSEEASNNMNSFTFVGEDVLWNSVLLEEKQKVSKPIRLSTEHKPPHDDGGPSIGDVLRCDICPYQTVSDNQLLEHLKAHAANGSFMCDVCGYKATSKYTLGRHTEAHTGKKRYSCKSCKKGFSYKKTLKDHMNEHSTKVAREEYVCNICDKLFSEKGMQRHLMIHSSKETIVCDICGEKFLNIERLKSHKDIHTDRNSYSCDICKQSFSRKSNLKFHMRIHSGENLYSCEICKREFTQNTFLRTHLKTHSEYYYSCEVCKKKLRYRGDLTRHMLIHIGQKSYSCDICKRSFSRKSNVILHMRIHSGERPYCCDVCKKKYSRKYHLIDHLRTHFGRRIPCSECGKTFTSESRHKIHMRAHLN